MNTATILIDGVIFQQQKGRPAGISRVWQALLHQLGTSPMADQIVLLDRGKTAPRVPGIKTQDIWDFNPFYADAEPLYLQEVMNALGGDLFLSTYFTYPENSACMIMLHDMTPEVMGHDLSHTEWMMKAHAIQKSAGYLCVSQSTLNDFRRIYPQHREKPAFLVPNATTDAFHPNRPDRIQQFRQRYGIQKPYYYLCGHRAGYKNAILFFRAFDLLDNKADFDILCTGGSRTLEPALKPFLQQSKCHLHFLNDEDLTVAYSAATALVYPSMYEGFGLPVLEAMQSGCPVIACNTSSIPEVAGDAALLVEPSDVRGMQEALLAVQNPAERERLIQRGYKNAERFSWSSTGRKLATALDDMLSRLPSIKENPDEPIHKGVRLIHTIKDETRHKPLRRALLRSIQLLPRVNASFDFTELQAEEHVIAHTMRGLPLQLLHQGLDEPDCDGFFHYWHGLIRAAEGDHKQALNAFEAAIELGVGSVRLGLLAAREADKLGRVLTACRYYQELLAIRPDFDEAQQAVKRLEKRQKRIKESMQVRPLTLPDPPQPFTNRHGEPLLSIIIPTKDRPRGLEAFLESLPAAMGALSYEVLLYQGGDRSPEITAVLDRHRVDHIVDDKDIFQPNEPFSWSRIMNHGFNQAKGTWVMYASDDIVLHPGAVPAALSLVTEDDNAGGITFLHRNTIEDYGGIFKDHGYDQVGGKTFINFGLVRRAAFQETQGFDERFRFYWADVDLCLQIWAAGYHIVPAPYSLVEHVNIVDAYRTANSGDRYFADTEAYYEKWHGHELFDGANCMAKVRHVLRSEDTTSILAKENSPLKGEPEPLVSAIISTYNSERFLRGCLDDVLAQHVEGGLEIIVVNSASQQNEAAIVEEYQQKVDNIVYIETQERETVYASWNRAIQRARGRYVTNTNTDDRHAPHALARMAAILETHRDVDVVYGDTAVTRDENASFHDAAIIGRFRWPPFNLRQLFQVCTIGPQPMWRRSLHDRFGLFDPSYTSAGDYEFWLRIGAEAGFVHIPQILGLYLMHEQSLEHQNASLSQEEAERARKQHWNPEDGPRPKPGGMFLERYDAASTITGLPLVSVIMPTRNRPQRIPQALDSIIEQTYPAIEVVIVNDAGEPLDDVLTPYSERLNLRLITLPEQVGPGAARNAGMRAAEGTYIAFLDDDDVYRPAHLVSLVAELEANPALIGAYTDALQRNFIVKGKRVRHASDELLYSHDFSREELLVRNYIPILCLMIRREAVLEGVWFNEDMKALEDWEWLIRLSDQGPLRHVPFVTAVYEVRHGGDSRNMLKNADIAALYQLIYKQHLGKTSKVRAAQGRYYHHMTGRLLEQDLPHLFDDDHFQKAAETLTLLLEAPDIIAAVQTHQDLLDRRLLELIQINADTARQDNNPDLAEGLHHLAEFIRPQLAQQPRKGQ